MMDFNSMDLSSCRPASTTSSQPITMDSSFRPGAHDVVFGRGGASIHNPANITYRSMVRSYQEQYIGYDDSRHMKTLLSQKLVNMWLEQSPPGRFLKKDEVTGLWNDVGVKGARRKTAQLLREGAKQLRKNLRSSESSAGSDDCSDDDSAAFRRPTKKVRRSSSSMSSGETSVKTSHIQFPVMKNDDDTRQSHVDFVASQGLIRSRPTTVESEPLPITAGSSSTTELLADLKDIAREEPQFKYGPHMNSLEMVGTFFAGILDDDEYDETVAGINHTVSEDSSVGAFPITSL